MPPEPLTKGLPPPDPRPQLNLLTPPEKNSWVRHWLLQQSSKAVLTSVSRLPVSTTAVSLHPAQLFHCQQYESHCESPAQLTAMLGGSIAVHREDNSSPGDAFISTYWG